MIDKIEILAPVGSVESLYAAVENGADAVYLGGKLFNARQYASNFTDDDLKNAVEYAHLRNVKVYVTANILLDDYELKEIIDYLTFLYNIDVDAVIVQDLGLARIIKELFPDFEVHGSTQMSINNYKGVQFLEELGFNRVVLARELSTTDIRYIKDNTNIELEAFIHGALCVSYSGQCLMSSLIGGRSGNRGTCAQPCRMPYSIVSKKDNKIINPKYEEKYLLSPKDLNTVEHLKDIIDAGIVSLKIEGRMKKPEYVAIIVNGYRKELDRILGIHNERLSEREHKDIAQMFNRGFTKGYINNEYGKNFISFDKPNNRGILIGEVVKLERDLITIKLQEPISKGDGIEIINKDGSSYGQIIDKILLGNKTIDASDAGSTIRLNSSNKAEVGAKVYKTFDLLLNIRAAETYTKKETLKRFPINMAVEISIGEPVRLMLWTDEHYISLESNEAAEKGLKVVLEKEKVINQMNKLGDTPYYLNNIDVNLEEGAMIPVSVLNGLRRKGIEELNKKRGNFNNRLEINREKINERANEIFNYPINEIKSLRKISVKVDNVSQFMELDLNKLNRVYLNFNEDIEACIKEIKKHNKEIYLSTEKIIDNMEFCKLDKLFDNVASQIDGISSSNIGTLKFIKDRYNTNIHCDIGLNIFNSSTVKLLIDNGVSSLMLSPELKLGQIAHICKTNNVEYEVLGYGHLPLMTTKHCPMSLVRGCENDDNCNTCELRSGYGLYDRKGMTFEMKRKGKSTVIYNSQPLIVAEYIDKIFSAGIHMMRLDFTIEKENIRFIQELYYEIAMNGIFKNEMKEKLENIKMKTGNTTGHFFRGVL